MGGAHFHLILALAGSCKELALAVRLHALMSHGAGAKALTHRTPNPGPDQKHTRAP